MAIADSIIGAESGGDPNARNTNSSASGPGQFLDRTWLDMLRQHRPDIQGSDADLLALKNDPALSRDMTAAYAADNAAILRQSGLAVSPGTTYLAHFAGPGGAVGLLNADPSTPAGSILGARVVAANPFLAKMTAGDVAAWADRKMGGGAAGAQPTGAPLSLAGLAAPPAPPPARPPTSAWPQLASPAPMAQTPNYDQQPAPLALIPARPKIDLRTAYANLGRR